MKGAFCMSVYQEAQNLILSLPEKNVKWIIDLIHMMLPSENRSVSHPIKLGVAKGKFCMDDEQFDAMDNEVSAMFEGE